LPADAQVSAQAKGRERFENFIAALGRRFNWGGTFLRDVRFEGKRDSEQALNRENDRSDEFPATPVSSEPKKRG
jgi:hypothetical protein